MKIKSFMILVMFFYCLLESKNNSNIFFYSNNTNFTTDTINIDQFGAKGDGLKDDSHAMQSALNFVSQKKGGVIELSEYKNYLISQQFILPANVTIKGKGKGSIVTISELNWENKIPRFFGVFTTVHIKRRPQDILYRMGSGKIIKENIVIENLEVHINRKSNKFHNKSSMSLFDFNVIRFEDSRNCLIKNCRFVDEMSATINNGSHLVTFVRSESCKLIDSFFQNCTPIEISESKNCYVINNTVVKSIGTAIETVGGSGHIIEKNNISGTCWNVSSIGINSTYCKILNNKIENSQLTAITLGHDEPLNRNYYYDVLPRADYSVCANNVIMSESTDYENSGFIGIIIQNGSNIHVENNTVYVRKHQKQTDYKGCVVVSGSGNENRFLSISIKNNILRNGTNGVIVTAKSQSLDIENNTISNTLCGIYYANIAHNKYQSYIKNNKLKKCVKGILIQSGNWIIDKNDFSHCNDPLYAFSVNRGRYVISRNYLYNCGKFYLSLIESLSFTDNTIKNDVFNDDLGVIFNMNRENTLKSSDIIFRDNKMVGVKKTLKLVQVIGQKGSYIE